MAKAVNCGMNYYEKLVKRISQSMEENPRSAMVMDMNSFRVIAKGTNLAALTKKMSGKTFDNTIVFQKPNQNASWIL